MQIEKPTPAPKQKPPDAPEEIRSDVDVGGKIDALAQLQNADGVETDTVLSNPEEPQDQVDRDTITQAQQPNPDTVDRDTIV